MKRDKLFTLFFFVCFSAQAQVNSTNTNAWLHYMGSFGFSPKWGASMETSFRSANVVQDFQQFFIRPSVDYKLLPSLTGSLGYTHVITGVYGTPALNKRTMPENHAWLQASHVLKANKFTVTNRLRNENRWVGLLDQQGDVGPYTYRNRMRYMLLISTPIVQKGSQTISAFAGNEVFLNVGERAGTTLLNQNRILGGLAYKFNPKHQIQFAYLHQKVINHPNTLQENNSTLRLSWVSNIQKIKKPVFTPNERILSAL